MSNIVGWYKAGKLEENMLIFGYLFNILHNGEHAVDYIIILIEMDAEINKIEQAAVLLILFYFSNGFDWVFFRYVMDELGSALRHSDEPNFRVCPFLYMPEGKLVSAVRLISLISPPLFSLFLSLQIAYL